MITPAPAAFPPASIHLAFNGAAVLLVGLVIGAPYASAIKRGAHADMVNAWRVALASLPVAPP